MAIKIKTYKIGKRGARGNIIGLPRTWVDDVGIGPGDMIDIYRDDADRLIFVPRKADSDA